MNKITISIIIAVVLVGVVGGTMYLMGNTSIGNEQNQTQVTERGNQATRGQLLASTTPATVDDLVVGEEITVIGTSNTDGSMTAQTVIIGSIDQFGGEFSGSEQSQGGGSTPEGFEGRQPIEGFDPQELQNLSPEERQVRFAELRESGTFPEGGFTGGGQGGRSGGSGFRGGNMIRGKILDIDDITITIALPDSGSRLVLYSSQTTILKLPESEM